MQRMQNQAAVEALYSATFVEDYLDCVENLPNDLQRHLSRLREFDLTQYSEFLRDLNNLVTAFEKETTASGQRAILAKIQLGLIAAQDIGDDKLATVQAMADLIENKARQLEQDSKNLDFGRDDDDDSAVNTTHGDVQHANNNSSSASMSLSSGPKATSATNHKANKESTKDKAPVKRRKKQHTDSGSSKKDNDNDDAASTVSSRSGGGRGGPGSRGGVGNSSSTTGGNTAKRQAVKRKSSTKRTTVEKDDSDKEIDLSNIEIDPDEPTYCLCDQVSYGEMIGCDNDLCPIEWFHFNCVQLSSKPKGKWFCPKCRGDKPTLMKPKAQFLKELEKYNKEREEKMMKQNG